LSRQATEVVEVKKKGKDAEVQQVVKESKANLRGSKPLKINYEVDGLSLSVEAHHHTLKGSDVQEAMKRLIVWRDDKKRLILKSRVPTRDICAVAADQTGASRGFALDEVKPDQIRTVVESLVERAPEPQWPGQLLPLSLVILEVKGVRKLYLINEVDKSVISPFLKVPDEKGGFNEEPFALFDKTREISVTKEDLRPITDFETWLPNAFIEIFAVGPEERRMWKICEDLEKKDKCIAKDAWVEAKGTTEYAIFLKPFQFKAKGLFELLAIRSFKPFDFKHLMQIPMNGVELQVAEAPVKRVSLRRQFSKAV
jgi:hypothetical protein